MNEILEKYFKIKSLVIKQFILYGMVALIPTAVDFILIFSLTELIGLYYMLSLVIAFVVAMIVSYLVQKSLTFRDESARNLKQFFCFCLVGLGGLILNMIIVFSLVEYLGFWYLLGKVVAVTITYFWSFGMNKQFTFKPLS